MSDIESTIWQKYKDKGVLVYGIYQSEPGNLIADFIEQTGISYPVIKDNGTLGQFKFAPGVGYPFPRDVVIGKDGIVHSIKSSFNVQEMDTLIQQLLAQ